MEVDRSSLRIGIVGCGRVVERFHLPALRDLGALAVVAAADASAERREWIESQIPGIRTFPSGDDLFDDVKLDAVLIAVPPAQQARWALAALDAGLHVMVEKPGGVSRSEAERLAERAARSKGKLRVGLNRRFMSNYRRLRKKLHHEARSGPFQGVYSLEVDRRAWAPVGGMEDLGSTAALLLDLVPHQLDALGWLIPDEIARVRGLTNEPIAGGRELRFEVEYQRGGRIECRARHGRAYDERLWIDSEEGAAALYPTGTVTGRLAAAPARDYALPILTWLDRKWIRLGRRADVMAASFLAQLEAFASEIRGGPADELACGAGHLVAVHTLLEAVGAEVTPRADPTGAAGTRRG